MFVTSDRHIREEKGFLIRGERKSGHVECFGMFLKYVPLSPW